MAKLAPTTKLIGTNSGTVAVVSKPVSSDYQLPTKSSDFIASQPDLTMNLNLGTTPNEELKNSLTPGPAKFTTKEPTGSMSHYLKGSGTEGTVPEYAPFLLSAMGGLRSVNVERSTTAGSTKSVLKCAEAADYSPGDSVLVKDDVGGWEARPVIDVTATDLTLGFDLTAAPASGVKLGKAQTYYPTNDNQPFFDITHYFDGGKSGMEYHSNCRIDTMTISATASGLTNCNFSWQATGGDKDPTFAREDLYFIESNNSTFRVFVGSNTALVRIPKNEYRVTSTTASETLAAALQAAIRAVSGTNSITTANYTVTYSASTKKYTFTKGAGDSTIGLNFADSAGNLKEYLGFTADVVAAASPIVSTVVTQPEVSSKVFRVQPAYDTSPLVTGLSQWLFLGNDSGANTALDASGLTVTLTNTVEKVPSMARDSGYVASFVGQRTIDFGITTTIQPYQKDWFNAFENSTTLRSAFVWGTKTQGKWDAGNSGVVFLPTANISSYGLTKAGSYYVLDLTVSAVSTGGIDPVFMSFL